MDLNEKGAVGSDAHEKEKDSFNLEVNGECVKPIEDQNEEIEEFSQDEGWTTLQPEPSERLRVELLSDNQGVFGVGTIDENRFEKIFLITRPDRMVDYAGAAIAHDRCALQPVPRPRFCHTVEGELVQMLHKNMAQRHGLLDEQSPVWRSWSEAPDPKRARQIYHGLKIKSLKIVNSVIRKALEVADQKALIASRRFPIRYRAQLYRSFCQYGERAIQLAGTFPLLAVTLFTDSFSWNDADDSAPGDWEKRWRQQKAKDDERRWTGISMVLKGVRLNKIAAAMGILYRLRHVKPGATRWVDHPPVEALDCLPKTTRKQRLFFLALGAVKERGIPFDPWLGEFIESMANRGAIAELDEIVDWLCSEINSIPEQHFEIVDRFRQLGLFDTQAQPRRNGGAEFVTRPFSPDMSLKTVRQLTAEWHEAVANNMTEGKLQKFPQPWINGAEIDAHKIVPITDSRELYLASKALHNCANGYEANILGCNCYLYTVSNGDNRPAAMVEMVQTDNGVVLRQIKGCCNASAPKEIERMVRRWFNRNKSAVRLPDPPERAKNGLTALDGQRAAVAP